MKKIRILAVNDPAISVYVDELTKINETLARAYGIKIEMDVIDFAAYYEILMSAFRESYYDIVMVAGHLWLPFFVQEGYLRSFELEEDDDFDYEDVLENIRREMVYKNQQYLMPSFCDGHMLLFSWPEISLDEHRSISIRELTYELDRYTSSPIQPFVMKAHPSEIFLDFLPYLRGYDVEPFDLDGQPMFFNENGIKALNRYVYLTEYMADQALTYGNEQVCNAFWNNDCLVGMTWSGQIGQVLSEQCKAPDRWCISYPEKPWNVTWSFAINHKSEQEEEALLVMKALASKTIDQKVGAFCGNPTRTSNFIEGQSIYRWYKTAYEMITNSYPLPQFPQLPEAIGIFSEELVQAVMKNKSNIEALNDAQTRIMDMLGAQSTG